MVIVEYARPRCTYFTSSIRARGLCAQALLMPSFLFSPSCQMTGDPRYHQTYGGDDGSMLTYTTQTRLVKTSTGGSLVEEEEVLVGGTTKKVPPPTTVIEMDN